MTDVFAPSYFAPTYFPPVYFPPAGEIVEIVEDKVRPYGDRWHDHGPRIQQEDEDMIILLRAIVEVISCR